jgi:CDP-diacylglycerol---serine O-phosphatidyltransferase
MFVLPNLFTLSSIFCGFYAITLCAGDATPSQLYQAALAIFFAIFFDGFDGRVARLTRTQSQFGIELDSLADVISFGVAPAMLVYKWALIQLGFIGMFISFAFAACAALRLARFNVLAQKSARGTSRFFVGLPTPLAAGTIVSMVIAHHVAKGGPIGDKAHIPIAVVVAVLSVLMVSTVRYRTLKDVRVSPKSAAVFMLVLAGGVVVAAKFHPAYVLAAYFATYLAVGLIESGVLLKNHIAARRLAASTPAASGGVLSDDDDDEEESDELDEEDFL